VARVAHRSGVSMSAGAKRRAYPSHGPGGGGTRGGPVRSLRPRMVTQGKNRVARATNTHGRFV
jgi:hypothetical protein